MHYKTDRKANSFSPSQLFGKAILPLVFPLQNYKSSTYIEKTSVNLLRGYSFYGEGIFSDPVQTYEQQIIWHVLLHFLFPYYTVSILKLLLYKYIYI